VQPQPPSPLVAISGSQLPTLIPTVSFPEGNDQHNLHQLQVDQINQTIQAATTFPDASLQHHDDANHQYPSWKQGELSAGLQQDLVMATSGYDSYTAMLSGGDTNWAQLQELMEPTFNNGPFLDNCNAELAFNNGPFLEMEENRNANEITQLDNQNLNELGITTDLFMPTPLLPVVTSQPPPALSFNIQPDESGPSIQRDERGLGTTFQTRRSRVTGDETETSVQLGSRNRKPTGPREVIPLTAAKDGSVVLPAWLESGLAYLSRDIEEKIWAECLEIWIEFEKDSLSDVASVSPRIMKRVHLK
jgi:hypothetical protein